MSEEYSTSPARAKYEADISQAASDSRRDVLHSRLERRATRLNRAKNVGRMLLAVGGLAGGVAAAEAALNGQQEKNAAVAERALQERDVPANEMGVPPEPPVEAPGENPVPVEIPAEQPPRQ